LTLRILSIKLNYKGYLINFKNMDINKKHIIIFGTLILLLIIIVGGITYYQEENDVSNVSKISNINEAEELSYFSKYGYYLRPPGQKVGQAGVLEEKSGFFYLSQPKPSNYEELIAFISFCKNARLSGINELRNEEIKQVVCLLTEISPDTIKLYGFDDPSYLPGFFALKSMVSFEANRYIGISVDVKDIIKKYIDMDSFLEEELYFCSISEPALADPLILQIESKYDFSFDEGGVSCTAVQTYEDSAFISVGFVPQAESINIKLYLVDELTISDVISKQSFLEMKEIIENHPVLWHMEKPINL
jgi:hypothetical protein